MGFSSLRSTFLVYLAKSYIWFSLTNNFPIVYAEPSDRAGGTFKGPGQPCGGWAVEQI